MSSDDPISAARGIIFALAVSAAAYVALIVLLVVR